MPDNLGNSLLIEYDAKKRKVLVYDFYITPSGDNKKSFLTELELDKMISLGFNDAALLLGRSILLCLHEVCKEIPSNIIEDEV